MSGRSDPVEAKDSDELVDAAKRASQSKDEAATAASNADQAQRWVVATKQVRTAAQWMIASLGAGAAVIFGAGPIVTGGEIQSTGASLLVAVLVLLAVALLGAAGVIYLIVQTAEVLLPHTVALPTLPSDFVQRIERTPHAYLTTAVETVEEFRVHLRDRTRALKNNRSDIERLRASMKELELQLSEDQTEPPVNRHNAEQQLQTLKRKLNAREVALRTQEANLQLFERKRDELLEQAAYEATLSKFTKRKGLLALAAVAAVVGGVGYVAAWGVVTAKADSPTLRAGLMQGTGEAGAELWEAVGLTQCEAEGNAGVPVIVESGRGSADDPFVVRTLGVPDGCAVSTFPVVSDVATVFFRESTEVSIEYEPLPKTAAD